MKKSTLIVSFTLLGLVAFGQEDKIIGEIHEKFDKWQPIIEDELKSSTQLFHYAWGENYQEDEWYFNEQTDKGKFLYQRVTVIEKHNLGAFAYYDNYSMSGDWYIAVDYYFDTYKKLYFIFWRMNTFQADEPLTIEKRLYFNSEGEVIRELVSKYKMNSKKASTAGYSDRNVEYELQLNKMNFYSKWKMK